MEKILKSKLKKTCKFTRKKISNKKRMVGTKVASVWVKPGDVTDCLAGVESLIHSAFFRHFPGLPVVQSFSDIW